MQEDHKTIADQEIRRRRILALMDQDVYISRYDLPGAAKTNRFGIVAESKILWEGSTQNFELADDFELDKFDYSRVQSKADRKFTLNPDETVKKTNQNNITFSLIAFFSDRFLWLEELGNALCSEDQIQLMTDINAVVEGERKPLKTSNFNWPVHNNPQFDQSIEAAMTSLGGFLDRLNSEFQWEKCFLLGGSSAARISSSANFSPFVTLSSSSREMILRPESKRFFWSELLEHVKG